jgi:hypothetical protein
MGSETVDTFEIDGKSYDVVGCWDEETPEDQYDHFCVYDSEDPSGDCFNLGEPFYERPTIEQVTDVVREHLRARSLP